MRIATAAAALLVLAACSSTTSVGLKTSSSPSAAASASASSSPSARPALPLMVLLIQNAAQGDTRPDTIVMLTADGEAIASTNFNAPAANSSLGCPDVTLPPARVAAGAAYYADSGGTIHRFAPDDSDTAVARFPIGAQSDLSFAVSPDGQKLIAIVITSPSQAGGHFALDLEEANAGGPTTNALHKDLGTALLPGPTVIAGWDNAGPVATLNSNLCAQDPAPSAEFVGSPLIHLAPDGRHLDAIGGSACVPLDELPNGVVLCSGQVQADGGESFSVRNRTGAGMWNAEAGGALVEPRLSPNGLALFVNDSDVDLLRDGAQQAVSLTRSTNTDFSARGWFGNDDIVVVYDGGTRLGLIAMKNLDGVINIGKTVPTSATVTSVGSIGL